VADSVESAYDDGPATASAEEIGRSHEARCRATVLEPAARPVMREAVGGGGGGGGGGGIKSARMAMTGSTRAARRAGR
jgi:hypothetical protein